VYRERSSTEPPFFFMYTCLFSNLHVSLPFETFTVGALQALNVAPSQLHPNTWASMQAFRVVCQTFGVCPSASCILHFYTSHPSDPISWHSLVSRVDNILFKAYTASYKILKRGSFKCLWISQVCRTSLMLSGSLGFLYFGPGNLQR